MNSRRVLILFAHPALQKSRCNRRLLAAVRGMEGVTIHDLYEEYSDFNIHVDREQKLLVEHDVVIYQHPFYWYSCPALLKEWLDLVLEHNFAYGDEGTALCGKINLSALTTGGSSEAYRPEGLNRFTMRQLLTPFDQTAVLCGMRWLAPFVVSNTFNLDDASLNAAAAEYRAMVAALRDGTVNVEAASAAPAWNASFAMNQQVEERMPS